MSVQGLFQQHTCSHCSFALPLQYDYSDVSREHGLRKTTFPTLVASTCYVKRELCPVRRITSAFATGLSTHDTEFLDIVILLAIFGGRAALRDNTPDHDIALQIHLHPGLYIALLGDPT
jgi:hypothetical protein